MKSLWRIIAVCLLSLISHAGMAQPALPQSQSSNMALPSTLVLAATDWCPYSCVNDSVKNANSPQNANSLQNASSPENNVDSQGELSRPGNVFVNDNISGQSGTPVSGQGIVVDYLRAILADWGVELQVHFYPWSRAVMVAKQGQRAQGLLTAVPVEAPGMRFTSRPTMNYGTCMLTRDSSEWHYESPESLGELTVGYIQDYSYGEFLDRYIQTFEGTRRLTMISSMGGVVQLSRMLKAGRIDGFVSDPLVALHELRGLNMGVKVNACFETQSFFMALHPDFSWGETLIAKLEGAFQENRNKQLLQTLVVSYIDKAIELPLDRLIAKDLPLKP